MTLSRIRGTFFAFVMLGLAPLWAGVWFEAGDAPDGPSLLGQQITMGTGSLEQIIGFLDRRIGIEDHVDTFCITVTDPALFYASTAQFLGGFLQPVPAPEALLDSRLWLWTQAQVFDGVSQLLLANDDTIGPGGPDLASTISDPATFELLTGGNVEGTATGIALVAGEQYLLSISTFPNDPVNAMNVPLAELGPNFTDLHGPDGVGPFDHWENDPRDHFGMYIIALRGAGFCAPVPEPTSGLSILVALISMAAIQNRKRSRSR